jgi:hypothetical protein
MNSTLIEIAELVVLALVALFISWQIYSSLNALKGPLQSLVTMLRAMTQPKPLGETPFTPPSVVIDVPRELPAPSSDWEARIEAKIDLQYREILARLDALATQKSLAEGLREILLRDFSRTATKYPRRLRIDFAAGGIENVGKVDGAEFLANLLKVRFQLACEAGNCDGKNNTFLSDSVYEIKQPCYFVGTLRKVTGGSDPALVLFDSVNRFEEFINTAFTEGARVALHVTVNLALTHPVALTGVVPLDGSVGVLLDRLKKGLSRPEEIKDLWLLISKNDFTVRDMGGTGHNQLGSMMERRDEQRNQPLFGGLTRIVDADRGYMWVCPAHAQLFMESLRDMNR